MRNAFVDLTGFTELRNTSQYEEQNPSTRKSSRNQTVGTATRPAQGRETIRTSIKRESNGLQRLTLGASGILARW